MSVESMGKALQVQGLTPSEKLCLIGMANHDGDGGCWPSIATLARYMGCKERNVQYTIQSLVDKGFVTVVRNAGGTQHTRNDQRPNLYKLHLDGVQPTAPGEDDGVQSDAQRGAIWRADGVQPIAPEPSLEPSVKPTHLPAAPDGGVSQQKAWEKMSTLGGDGDEKKPEGGSTPARQVVDQFEVRWGPVRNRHKEYWSFPVVPHRVAAYTWLNQQYFKNKTLALAQVLELVDSFMALVDADQITPNKGYSIWSTFVGNIAKLESSGADTDYGYTVV